MNKTPENYTEISNQLKKRSCDAGFFVVGGVVAVVAAAA